MSDEAALDLLARMLRQRGELGAPPLFLDGLDRAQALALLARAAVGGAEASAPVARPAAASGSRAGAAALPAQRPRGSEAAPSQPTFAPPPRPAARAATDAIPADATLRPGPLPILPMEHGELKQVCSGCARCVLSRTRTQVVFNDGVPSARLMVLGEAPGQNEDETGLPFVGAAGKLLDLLLMSVDLTRRESVYICNVLKCRPPGNRNPLPEEIEACRPILERQIEVVAPEVILAVGTFAAQWLTGSQAPLGKLRGSVYRYRGVPLVVTYHPAAILRNQGWARPTWDDFQLLRQILDRGAPPAPDVR